ncbi:MAG: hypothetical protein GY747_01915 [Planctomycetes bacterium]|nr:hypothetical protein [Planctomycetota bacterium]
MPMLPLTTRSLHRQLAQRGAVGSGVLVLAGLILAGAVAWVLLSGSPVEPIPEDPQQIDTQEPAIPNPQEAVLEPGPLRDLPGSGELMVELEYLGTEADQHLRVQRQGTLEGVIYGAAGNGAPLDDAIISVFGGPQDGLSTRTDFEGKFELPGLIPGTHFFRIDSSQHFSVVRMQRVVSLKPTKRDFFLGTALDMELLIRDHKNKPLENARVLVNAGLQEGVTDEEGVVLIGNVVGGRRVLVDVRAEGYVPVRYELNLFAEKGSPGPTELPAMMQGGTVRGRVKSWPGGALPRVTLVPRATQPGSALVAWEIWQDIETDREGRFTIENVPTTHLLDIRAFHPWGVCDPRMRAVTPSPFTAANIEFVIRESKAKVTGKVYGTDGRPQRGVELSLLALNPDKVLAALYPGLDSSPVGVRLPVPAQMQRITTSDVDGSFEFAVGDHVSGTGSMVLLASAPGNRTARHEVQTVGQDIEVHLKALDTNASLNLARLDEGPLPPSARWSLNGEDLQESSLTLGDLQEGFYRVKVSRDATRLWARDSFFINRGTAIDLAR